MQSINCAWSAATQHCMKRLNSVLLHLDLLNCHHVGRVLLAGNLYCILLPQDEFGSYDPYAIFASLYISTSAGYEQLVFHQQSYEGCINVTVDWPHHAAAADFSLGQCNSTSISELDVTEWTQIATWASR